MIVRPVADSESSAQDENVEISTNLRSAQKKISNQTVDVGTPLEFNQQNKEVATVPIRQGQITLCFCLKDSLTAELLWCLEVISSRSSFNSCQNKKELFQKMFPCDVSKNFSLCPKKASYLITDALTPYFRDILLTELKDNLFTLQFDETSNSKKSKELEVRVIFFSPSINRVINNHLSTKFLKNGLGVTIFDHLMLCLDENGLSLKNLITLGRDGPNVNKTVAGLFNEKLKLLGYKPLLDFSSCYLHIVNNGFKSGLDNLSVNVAEFITSLKKFFDQSDVRWHEFEDIQNEIRYLNEIRFE